MSEDSEKFYWRRVMGASIYIKCLMPLVVKIAQKEPLGRLGRCVLTVAKKRPEPWGDKKLVVGL